MFANYPSRKNVSHTRANRCRNASAVGLPAAPVSITSQEAASSGLLWSSSRKTCLFREECSGGCSQGAGAKCPSGLAGLYVSLTPLSLSLPSPPLLSFPLISLLSLSLTQSMDSFFLTALLLHVPGQPLLSSQKHLSPIPFPLVLLFLLPPPKLGFIELGGKKFSGP